MEYTANVGAGNAAWLAGGDGPLAGTGHGITDNGGGIITADAATLGYLAGLPEHYDGCVTRAGAGFDCIHIEGTGYQLQIAGL